MSLLKQWKGVNGYMIRNPGTFFSEYNETHGVGYPLQFLLLTFAVIMTPLALLMVLANVTSPTDAALGAAIIVFLGLLMWVSVVIEAVLAHGIASLLGASGVSRTLEAYAFPSLIRYGLWWFPLINFVFGLYGWYLQIKALASFHDISAGKALVATLIASLLPVIFMLIVIPVLLVFTMDMGQPP
ncbi:YIP1 family protein [Halopiger djelfimassiliensis]|uniref:YIP1 family protein n=1 Tax=Halopiger djelfimassiliensis TaxID=1293047 RepID=UPI00067792E7|nr:YIP1 family protein [Halopiger djelfimassiliensis]